MFILSGLGDEISSDLQEQLTAMKTAGINYLELRGAWDKNVLDLTDADVQAAARILTVNGFKISSIGSPIGKIKITDDFAPHFERFQRAVGLAKLFHARYVRVFSYYPPENGNIDDYRDEVLKRMAQKVRYAEKEGVVLVHENDLDIYGRNPENCLDLLESINSPNFRALLDPANFAISGIPPYERAYPLLKPWIEYIHVKDGLPLTETGNRIVCLPAGEGKAKVREILEDFAGYIGDRKVFLSIEAHLGGNEQFKNRTGSERFMTAANALLKILSARKAA